MRLHLCKKLSALTALSALLTSAAQAQNLVANGDFSAGNTGFTSHYTLITTVSTSAGQYGIVTNPGTAYVNDYASFGDHTTGTGNMQFVDGGGSTAAAFWSQTVAVTANTPYVFSFWATPAYAQNPTTLRVLLNGAQLGNDFPLTSSPGTWQKFSVVLNSGSKTSLTFSLLDVNPNWGAKGDDFCVDDISLTKATPADLARVDFNGDGKRDLLFQNASAQQVAVWYMNNSTRLDVGNILPNQAAGWNCAGTADFNQDGKPDLLWHNPTTGQMAIWYLNNTTLLAGAYLSIKQSTAWKVVALADVNQDGYPDIVFQNPATGQLAVWRLNNSAIVGGSYVTPIQQVGWACVGSGDANGDGKPDLFFQNPNTGQMAVWLMNGVQAVGGQYISKKQALGWGVMAVSDMNGDGKPDLVFQNGTTGQLAVWYLNGATVTGGAYLSASAAAGWKCVGPK
ncbi:MAG TPA: FG-GAP-like repeat-containing protein [Chthonomonadaceae bacterium]|nr:FG-GAP-like repeat-containing protein [Chthonomonadaceae bacterium]